MTPYSGPAGKGAAVKKRRERKWLAVLLLSGLMILVFSACSVPMKETEAASRTEAAEPARATNKEPEQSVVPRLKLYGSGSSLTELSYDRDGNIRTRTTHQIAESDGKTWIETETISFDPQGNITDYRQEGVPEEQRQEDETIRFEENRLTVSSQDHSTTTEFEKGRMVSLHIQSPYQNYLIRYEYEGQEVPVRRVLQIYELDAEQNKHFLPAQILTCRYAYDAVGLPLYSYLTDAEGAVQSDYSFYIFENRPDRTDGSLLRAVMGAESVIILTRYAGGQVKENEEHYLSERYDDSGSRCREERKAIIGFETNGDILSWRAEGDPSAEEEPFTVSGDRLELPLITYVYRQGRVIRSHLSFNWDDERLMHRETIYKMDEKGLYEGCSISWYLTSAKDPSGARESLPDNPDSERTFVYHYDENGRPLWSYQTDEQGQPVKNSLQAYLFE